MKFIICSISALVVTASVLPIAQTIATRQTSTPQDFVAQTEETTLQISAHDRTCQYRRPQNPGCHV